MPPQQIPLRQRPGEQQRHEDGAAVAEARPARAGARAPLPRGDVHGAEGAQRGDDGESQSELERGEWALEQSTRSADDRHERDDENEIEERRRYEQPSAG